MGEGDDERIGRRAVAQVMRARDRGKDPQLLFSLLQAWHANGTDDLVRIANETPPPDFAALRPFVGRYEIGPCYVDDVHWEAGALVATASGQTSGARLVPVSATAFSPDGVGALIVFERDATGRVIGYVQGYANGRVVRARRLP